MRILDVLGSLCVFCSNLAQGSSAGNLDMPRPVPLLEEGVSRDYLVTSGDVNSSQAAKTSSVFSSAIFRDCSGSEPKEDLYFTNPGNKSGMFSTLTSAVGLLERYESSNCYSGIHVDFQGGLYYDPSYGDNWFEYYFEPININEEGSGESVGDYHVSKNERMDLFYNVERNFNGTGKPIPRDLSSSIFRKYFRIKPEISEQIQDFIQRNFAGKHVIGVHYRGTDKTKGARAESQFVSYEEMASHIRHQIQDQPDEDFVLFVATDEQGFIDFMQREFPGKVVTNEAQRSSDGNPIHLTSKTPYLSGREALVDCMLLGSSDVLIRTSSNLSFFSKLINPDIPVIEVSERLESALIPIGALIANSSSKNSQEFKKSANYCQVEGTGKEFCEGNLGLSREVMPQLESPEVLDSFLHYSMKKTYVDDRKIFLSELRATQNEINEDKVRSIMGKEDPCQQTILVAYHDTLNRFVVIDGHHRAAACYQKGIETDTCPWIFAHTFYQTATEVLSNLSGFPGVTHRRFDGKGLP